MGNVAPPIRCSTKCNFSSQFEQTSIFNLVESSQTKHSPLCASYDCESDVMCQECQTCLNAENFNYTSLNYATCLSTYEYGLLSSYGYTIPFIMFTFIGSQVSQSRSLNFRRNLVIFTAFGWAFAIALQGLAVSSTQLYISRTLLGAFEAVSTPFSYSLIAEIFPKEKHGQKNGIFTFGVYIGGALGSVSIFMSRHIGYEMSSYLISGFTLLSALGLLLSTCVVKVDSSSLTETLLENIDESEAPRLKKKYETSDTLDDSFVTREGEKLLSLWTEKSLWILYLAAGLRLVGGFSLAYYGPVFFGRRFPNVNVIYGSVNAVVVVIFGPLSAYYGTIFCLCNF